MTSSRPTRTHTNPREDRRDESLDIAKGFAILLVVFGHSLDGLSAAGFFPASPAWPTLTLYVIYLFHMPLFFAASGHLTSDRQCPPGATLVRLIRTLVYPYFLWSIVTGLALVFLSEYTNGRESLSNLYKILWIPIGPYWFLYALFLCQVAYLATRRLSHGVQLAIAVALFLLPQFFLGPLGEVHLFLLPETARGFLYFILGAITVSQVRQFGRWVAMAATVLFVLFAIVYYQSQFSGVLAAPAALPAGIAGIIATVAWSRMLATAGGWFATCMAFCGRYWRSIYLMHIFFTAGTRIALERLVLAHSQWSAEPRMAVAVVATLIATFAGIAFPLAITWLLGKFNLERWFGLPRMETA